MPGIDGFTKLVLHCDGTDGSTSFPDSSFYTKTVTANAGAQVDTAQFKFGNASMLGNGTTAYLSSADNDDYELGGNNFTLDTWVRFNAVTENMMLIGKYTTATPQRSWFWAFNGLTGNMDFRYSNDGSATTLLSQAWSPSTATWYHVAAVRTGNNLLMFVDGSQIGSTDTITGTLFNGTASLIVGGFNEGTGGWIDGWLDEVRISNGVARWTANFTPPTAAYAPDNPLAWVTA